MVKNKFRRRRLLSSSIYLKMIKSTPEFEAKIKASGVPVIEITLEQLLQTKLATKEEIQHIYNKHKQDGTTNNR